MEYNEISYIEKLGRLQKVYMMSTSLAEAIGVSRRSLPNWRDKPESIKPEYRFNSDALCCKHFLIPEWDKPGQSFAPVLVPDSLPNNDALPMPFLRHLSYGTIEIETGMSRMDFDLAINAERLPKNMTRETFHEAVNAYFTLTWLWRKIVGHGETFRVSEESIKVLHASFMKYIRDDAGFYSTKMRVMGIWRLCLPDTLSPEPRVS